MAKRTEISAAEAMKAFKSSSVTVQTATPVKIKGEDGKERPGFKTDKAKLEAAHIIGAASYGDGRVAIATIDGRKHEARA